jgi:hypothetical protein
VATGDADTTVAHYEHLRRHAVSGRISGIRHGLAVMLQKGMAAWMEQLSLVQTLAERKPSDRTGAEQILPDGQCDELVDLLTNLALARLTEVNA